MLNGGVQMKLKALPKDEMPREKLVKLGASSLSDAELLAIFLRTGIKGTNVVALASNILADFGTLRALLAAGEHEFCQTKGLGVAKYVQLQAVVEMSRRFLAEKLERSNVLTSPQESRDYIRAKLRDQPHEVFAVLFLDNKHRVIRFEELFYGTIDSASVYPRVVVKKALERNAAAVIFAHNHPSGIAEPSHADRMITDKLISALQLIDVKVLDHFVIGDSEIASFAERGWV